MPGPLPGMDPYLEDPARWSDVHQSLITYIRDALQPQVRPRYHARMGERVYTLTPPRAMYPDVLLVQRTHWEPATAYAGEERLQATEAETLLDAPIVLTLLPVEHREPFVEIVHSASDKVVAVIEVLSPANKAAGQGHRLYRSKQQAILDSLTHLIEIDLLFTGLPTVAIPEDDLVYLPPRLPRLHIPLQEPDPDVGLDLQAVFAQCYDNGGYADLIDYQQPPPVTLSPEETAWLDSLLRGKGL